MKEGIPVNSGVYKTSFVKYCYNVLNTLVIVKRCAAQPMLRWMGTTQRHAL